MEKILYIITQSELGGAQKYVLDLALGVKDKFSARGGPASGWNVSVAFGEQGGNSELADELKNKGVKTYSIPHLKREISPLKDLLAIFEITKLIKKIKPDIIHLNSSKISILGSIAAVISKLLIVNCKLLIVYTVHGWVFNEPLSPAKKLFYEYAEKFTALFKNKIICISKLDYEIAKTELKIPEKKLSLIYHGIKPINFLSREKAQKKLLPITSYQLPVTNIIIGTIANLYKTKGLKYLIEAMEILKKSYKLQATSYKLIIIGEGKERKNLENLIKKYNLEKNIFLLGSIKNAAEYLKAFDIYVCSSVKEGLPYSILEAIQAGLPIISTNVGGIPEMIDDGKNGLLANPRDPKELAQKIKILIEDENLKNTLGAQAEIDAKEKFGIERMVEKTMVIYLK